MLGAVADDVAHRAEDDRHVDIQIRGVTPDTGRKRPCEVERAEQAFFLGGEGNEQHGAQRAGSTRELFRDREHDRGADRVVHGAIVDRVAFHRLTNAEMIQAQQDFEFKKELAIMQFQFDRELKMAELQMKRELQQQQMAQQAEQHRQQMEAGVFKSMQGQQAHEQKMEQAKAKPVNGE